MGPELLAGGLHCWASVCRVNVARCPRVSSHTRAGSSHGADVSHWIVSGLVVKGPFDGKDLFGGVVSETAWCLQGVLDGESLRVPLPVASMVTVQC